MGRKVKVKGGGRNLPHLEPRARLHARLYIISLDCILISLQVDPRTHPFSFPFSYRSRPPSSCIKHDPRYTLVPMCPCLPMQCSYSYC
jgi:hypothetical protein